MNMGSPQIIRFGIVRRTKHSAISEAVMERRVKNQPHGVNLMFELDDARLSFGKRVDVLQRIGRDPSLLRLPNNGVEKRKWH